MKCPSCGHAHVGTNFTQMQECPSCGILYNADLKTLQPPIVAETEKQFFTTPRITPRSRKVVLYVVGTLFILSVGWWAVTEYMYKVELQNYASDRNLAYEFLKKWEGERELSEQTSRIALSNSIARLQELKRVGDSLELKTSCISIAKKDLSISMIAEIEGLLAFMRLDTNQSTSMLNSARTIHNYFTDALFTCDPALQRDAKAQLELGFRYITGKGVQKDATWAGVWFQKAAAQGNMEAQIFLGDLYQRGDGVPKDAVKAIEWFQKAADQGNVDVLINLGNMYQNGDGIPIDTAKAAEWYEKAAAHGDAGAQYILGAKYQYGNGVPIDTAKAIEWLQKAAAQGNEAAINNLKLIH